MPWPKLLVLVRHAESEGNTRSVEERAAYEVPTHTYSLTLFGRKQAQATGMFLQAAYPQDFDVRYTSEYERARETMRIISPQGAKIYEDPRLREAERGIYHTYTRADLERHFPLEIERKKRDGLYHHRPLGGENWPDVEQRIHSFLGTLNRDYGGKRVLIVVHGHWLILFQRLIHHFSPEEAVKHYEAAVFQNASVTTYASDGTHLILQSENVVPWRDALCTAPTIS